MPVHLYINTQSPAFQADPQTKLATILRRAVADVEASTQLSDWVQEMAAQDLGGAVLLLEDDKGKPCGWMQWTAEGTNPGLLNWPQFPTKAPSTDDATTAEAAMLDELAEAQLDEMRDTLRQLDGDWRAAQHATNKALQQLEQTAEARRHMEQNLRELAALRSADRAGHMAKVVQK